MNKQEDINFLEIQTCTLKVNIHCEGCKKEIKKLFRKIDGVYKTEMDAEHGKVTVSGNVDPSTLIKRLGKAGKHAELLAPKGGSKNLNTQLQIGEGQQQDSLKGQKGRLLQQVEGHKDLKLPQIKDLKPTVPKEQKTVKFTLPVDDFDDEYDDEDDDFEYMDDGCEDDPKQNKLKPMILPANISGKKSGEGEGEGDVKVQAKNMGGDNNGNVGGMAQNDKTGGKAAPIGNGGKMGGGNYQPNMMMGHVMGPNKMTMPHAPMGNIPANGATPGYVQGAANPNHQPYMAAMMQQRASMDGYNVGYPRPLKPVPANGEPIGSYFSDENPNGCSIL